MIDNLMSVQVVCCQKSPDLNKFYSQVTYEKAFRFKSFLDFRIIDMGLWTWKSVNISGMLGTTGLGDVSTRL